MRLRNAVKLKKYRVQVSGTGSEFGIYYVVWFDRVSELKKFEHDEFHRLKCHENPVQVILTEGMSLLVQVHTFRSLTFLELKETLSSWIK